MRNVLDSGENYENFYEKTKLLDDIDEKSLIDKLKEAQDEIDYADYKQTMERSLEESDHSDEEAGDLMTDFTLRGVLFGKNKAEKLVDEGERALTQPTCCPRPQPRQQWHGAEFR